jgi:hypothetical protein
MKKIFFIVFGIVAVTNAHSQANDMPADTFAASEAWWIPTNDTVIVLLDTVSPKFNIHILLRRSLRDSIFISINGHRDSFVLPRNACIPSDGTIFSMHDGKESFSNFMILKDSLVVLSVLSAFTHNLSACWMLYRLNGKGPPDIANGCAEVAFVFVQPGRDRIVALSALRQDEATGPYYRRINIYSLSSRKETENKIFDKSIYPDDRPDIINFYKNIK